MAGMKTPPPSTKANLTAGLTSHARAHWPSLARINVRFRANFAYIDACEPDGDIVKLCRLRYSGSAHFWGFAIYRASHDDYEDSYLPTGTHVGTAEDAFDCAANLYIYPFITPPTTPPNELAVSIVETPSV